MNTIRMFVFVAAVLIIAFVFRVIAYVSTAQEPFHPATGTAAPVSQQSTEN
jgi:hypothetical protein